MKPLAECHVLVTPTTFGKHDPSIRCTLEGLVGRVTYNSSGKPLSSAQLRALLPTVDGYIAGLDTIDAAAIEAAPDLLVIARYGAGVDNLDLAAARRRGIIVTNTPGANAGAVAELTIALMLDLLRSITEASGRTRLGEWPRMAGLSLEGRTVGLVGFGAIGRGVARRLLGFGCRVVAYDVVADAETARRYDVEMLSLADLLAAADIVSLHLPALPETCGMVSAGFLSQMKPGAYLVNTARGELIDENALHAALIEKRLAGAALDAFAHEPPNVANPLLALPNVIPTPHMGAHTDGATSNMGRMALADCLAVLQGNAPEHPVP